MTDTGTRATDTNDSGTTETDTVVRPLTLAVDQTEIDDLARRLDATRWPDEAPDAGWADGLPLAYAKELAEYWRDRFDWRAQEERLNAVPQFTTGIDGHDIHFFHVRSSRPDAKPLLLVHGWPSGPTDFLLMIPLLTEPDDGGQAFDVIAPTIPGFGVSGPVTRWTLTGVADAFAELMERLGYDRYLVHGYDTGAGVARELGLRHGDHVAGIHTTGMLGGEELTEETADMSVPEEAAAIADGYRYMYDVGGYAMLQSTRPQSISYALTDSPVAQMSWLVERFRDWSAAEGDPDEVLDRDEMLTVVSIYWFFRTAGSSARYYKYGLPDWSEPLQPSTVPTAILVMPDDIGRPVRRLVETTDNVVHWTAAERGGHFAAWEQPELVAADIRAGIGDLT
ncbi:epoxide hydrolase family protein [Georgenia sp. Z1491]|uniref:epoxide hydrolase family protein n=1 Tax=Georgenia sp. Z1491 TaxID=3416707 RepID=UPI003CEBA3B7